MNLFLILAFAGILFALALYAAVRFSIHGSFKAITPDQLKAMLCKDSDFMILDVREPWEFRQGFIYKSLNLPVRKLSHQMEEISKLKEERIVVVCKSGLRSRMVCAFLEKEGFHHPMHLKGGIRGWLKAGLRLVDGKEEAAHGT